VTSKPN